MYIKHFCGKDSALYNIVYKDFYHPCLPGAVCLM